VWRAVLLDKWGGVVVSDFGISARLESNANLMPSTIKGTARYMCASRSSKRCTHAWMQLSDRTCAFDRAS
jgi:hypothetical protein